MSFFKSLVRQASTNPFVVIATFYFFFFFFFLVCKRLTQTRLSLFWEDSPNPNPVVNEKGWEFHKIKQWPNGEVGNVLLLTRMFFGALATGRESRGSTTPAPKQSLQQTRRIRRAGDGGWWSCLSTYWGRYKRKVLPWKNKTASFSCNIRCSPRRSPLIVPTDCSETSQWWFLLLFIKDDFYCFIIFNFGALIFVTWV